MTTTSSRCMVRLAPKISIICRSYGERIRRYVEPKAMRAKFSNTSSSPKAEMKPLIGGALVNGRKINRSTPKPRTASTTMLPTRASP